jgi:hypothetical protein
MGRSVGVTGHFISYICLFFITILLLTFYSSRIFAAPWPDGSVMAGVSEGIYLVYDNNGNEIGQTFDGIGGLVAGCAFDQSGDLYTTNFSITKVVRIDGNDPHLPLQFIDTALVSPFGLSESISFNHDGHFYVGHGGGNQLVHEYDAAGVFQNSFAVDVENNGSDVVDLSSDQSTLFYTSEGGRIMRFDVSGVGAQLPDFANIGGQSLSLRLLAPGDGSGGLLVAHNDPDSGDSMVKRLDSTGDVIQVYDVPGEDSWFALNLDPNGSSFWSANFLTSNIYRFNISTGAVEIGPINTGTGPGTLFGLCVRSEPTAGTNIIPIPDDDDEDGVPDDEDNCPQTANPGQEDNYGTEAGDACEDTDDDGHSDEVDNCPVAANPEQIDTDGNGVGDECDDGDDDGIFDDADNCPEFANPNQEDHYGTGKGDACEDTDGDGTVDQDDNCPLIANADQQDSDGDGSGDACEDEDGDGVPDDADNCPDIPNEDQIDADSDGVGDICEDMDEDGIPDDIDNCPGVSNPGQTDSDGNGVGDDCEDGDGDGVPNPIDNCPGIPNPDQIDTDGDGLGDPCDERCGDGVIDAYPEMPPACPNPNKKTKVQTRAQLDAWLANPTTSLHLKKPIAFNNEALQINTACDVITTLPTRLTGLTDVFISARRVDIRADIQATGRIDLRGEERVIVRQPSQITGPIQTMTMEAPYVDDRGDLQYNDLYCAEGERVIIRQASRDTGQGGHVSIQGDDVDIKGDFHQPGSVQAHSSGRLIFRQVARIENATEIAMSAGGLLDFHGDFFNVGDVSLVAGGDIIYRQASRIEQAGNISFISGAWLDYHGHLQYVGDVELRSDTLWYRQAMSIDNASSLMITVTGEEMTNFYGDIANSGTVIVNAHGIYLRQVSHFETNDDVTVNVEDQFIQRGDIVSNGNVRINTNTYRLYSTHDLTGNLSCEISGSADPDSELPNGCLAVP